MMAGANIRVATDVGGTFTDLAYFETDENTGEQRVRSAKVDTTPPDFERAVLALLDKAEVPFSEIGFLAHGTTVIINAITERKGAKTGLITTAGFRDVLEIARGDRPNFFNLTYRKPEPFVPRYLRREVPGRIGYLGDELVPLDLSGLTEIVETFRAESVEAIAICLLHSYANDAHEVAVLEEVRRLAPEIAVVASHQITRQWREYERTNTAVLSAYVQPIADRYLTNLDHSLNDGGFAGSLYIMQSNCGIDTVEATRQTPITMIESGPASGVWGAAELGRLLGIPNVLALDIGGTTAKCSLIEGGHAKVISDYWIERNQENSGYPVLAPVVDIVEIGNGGGSIAWVDHLGKLHVGPQSAGANPGPVSYGRGGTEPTTTDANLALGRINPDYFCGGTVTADMDGVNRALDRLAASLEVSREDAARGIVRIANHNMINALKLVSLNRGYDPRDFTLVTFGGGGGMHANALAAELQIEQVIIPAESAVFSAWGMVMSDLRRDYFKTFLCDLDGDAPARLLDAFGALEAQARAEFTGEGLDEAALDFVCFARFRYRNQEHSTEVVLPEEGVTFENLAAIRERFEVNYEREYTYRLATAVEVVGLHLVAQAEVGKLALIEKRSTGRKVEDAVKGRRRVDFDVDGVHEARLYDGALLEKSMSFAGPAIIEESGATIVVNPGSRARVDQLGNVVLTIE
jgi:N-methylhydantoinase A